MANAISAERSLSGATVEVGRAELAVALRDRLKASPELVAHLLDVQRTHPMSTAVGIGPGAKVIHNAGPVFRAAYLIRALQRIRDADDPAAQIEQERRHLAQHQTAQVARELGAMRLDAARDAYGRTLGWYARDDERVTPECAAANGKNFDAAHPPAIGLPGIGPHHGCRCTPGPPHAGAAFLPSGTPDGALPGTTVRLPAQPSTVAATADDTDETDATREPPELPDWSWWPPARHATQLMGGPVRGDIDLVSGDTSPFSSSRSSNWVAQRGGLPGRVRAIARAIKRKHPEWPLSRCIAVAINAVKHSAATGDVKGLPGRQNEKSSTVAAHSKAAAQWAAMKGKRGKGRKVRTTAAVAAALDLSASWDTPEQRRAWARSGVALPDGSFPIPTVAFLRKAIKAFGRAADKARAKAHIIKRARALGAMSLLPEGWA